MPKTVTVTRTARGARRVRALGTVFPVGQPVEGVDAKTIAALKNAPGIEFHAEADPTPTTPTEPLSGGTTP